MRQEALQELERIILNGADSEDIHKATSLCKTLGASDNTIRDVIGDAMSRRPSPAEDLTEPTKYQKIGRKTGPGRGRGIKPVDFSPVEVRDLERTIVHGVEQMRRLTYKRQALLLLAWGKLGIPISQECAIDLARRYNAPGAINGALRAAIDGPYAIVILPELDTRR